jgi:hypothetical protein
MPDAANAKPAAREYLPVALLAEAEGSNPSRGAQSECGFQLFHLRERRKRGNPDGARSAGADQDQHRSNTTGPQPGVTVPAGPRQAAGRREAPA